MGLQRRLGLRPERHCGHNLACCRCVGIDGAAMKESELNQLLQAQTTINNYNHQQQKTVNSTNNCLQQLYGKIAADSYYKQRQQQHPAQRACNCIGPQNGQPLCPCMMAGVEVKNGRYVKTIDYGPVK